MRKFAYVLLASCLFAYGHLAAARGPGDDSPGGTRGTHATDHSNIVFIAERHLAFYRASQRMSDHGEVQNQPARSSSHENNGTDNAKTPVTFVTPRTAATAAIPLVPTAHTIPSSRN